MKSVGEVMAIGRNIHELLQKALRGLETGLSGFNIVDALVGAPRDEIEAALARPTPDRLLVAAQALREGFSVAEIHAITFYDPWFLERIAEIVAAEETVCRERPAAGCGRHAAAQVDGIQRQAPGLSRSEIGESRRKCARHRARLGPDPRHGGGDDRRRDRSRGAQAAPPARRAAGVQADRHLRGRVRGEDALHVLDL